MVPNVSYRYWYFSELTCTYSMEGDNDFDGGELQKHTKAGPSSGEQDEKIEIYVLPEHLAI
jgi:hypothetical protein